MAGRSQKEVYHLPQELYPRRESPVRMRISRTPIPMLEALAEGLSSIPLCESEKTRITQDARQFKDSSGEALNEAIEAHARKCGDGSHDPQDEIRVLGNMCVAMYLADCVDRMLPVVMEKCDAGTASLFDMALARISGFLGVDYYQYTPGRVLSELNGIQPVLSSSLSRCGLDGLVWVSGGITDLRKIYLQYIFEVNHRIEEGSSRLRQLI